MTPAEHMARARECVYLANVISRQIEQHAIYLDQDSLEYLRDCAAQERIRAREHIRQAGLARRAKRAA